MGADRVRVLVVDDDEVIRQLISINLEMEGYEVLEAFDGQDALDKVKAFDPAVITLDVMMPRLDGWGTADALRADPETAGIKIVLLTARAMAADVTKGKESELVDEYLTKPFEPDALVEAVGRLAAG